MLDLVIIGGGINGTGIARDAAGRGMSVLLVERDDLASATSQWSTKLIHGGLRYLEHYEFRLVGESLAEREVLLAQAPHLIEPLSFVLPHEPHLRPAWMIRAGLFLYDRNGGRTTLPRSFSTSLAGTRYGAGLKPRLTTGFVYADARVDDARLVVATALAAQRKGADIRTRTRFEHAVRDGAHWRVKLQSADGTRAEVQAKAIVNAAGPWVGEILTHVPSAAPAKARVRHVQGSHIVVPRVHAEDHAYILQNADKRIVFVIPYQERYSLIGTTDVAVTAYEAPKISDGEVDYLLELANAYLARPLTRADIVWSYSGVRPLYDDGESDPSSITRDYVLKVDADERARAPILSVYGGKLTTYRRLAEAALETLRPYFPAMPQAWTEGDVLPGGDLPAASRATWIAELTRRYAGLPAAVVTEIAKRHGSKAVDVLGDARTAADLGIDFGNQLTEREVAYLVEHEWARSADDVLWRRTKAGLGMSSAQRTAVEDRIGAVV
jgi:glycerol-3-phosphate dehydrogenase